MESLYLAGGRVHLRASGSAPVDRALAGNDDARLWAMNKLAILKEFLEFLRERKKWWIAPIVIVLLLLGGLLILAKGSALAPFIYTLF